MPIQRNDTKKHLMIKCGTNKIVEKEAKFGMPRPLTSTIAPCEEEVPGHAKMLPYFGEGTLGLDYSDWWWGNMYVNGFCFSGRKKTRRVRRPTKLRLWAKNPGLRSDCPQVSRGIKTLNPGRNALKCAPKIPEATCHKWKVSAIGAVVLLQLLQIDLLAQTGSNWMRPTEDFTSIFVADTVVHCCGTIDPCLNADYSLLQLHAQQRMSASTTNHISSTKSYPKPQQKCAICKFVYWK